jgi:hypothetical protein
MEYREPPRVASSDVRVDGVVQDAAPRRRPRRFEFVRSERQIDVTRVVLAGGLLLATVSLIGYLGLRGIQGAIQWLRDQPQYRVRFRDIVLVDPPPPWFRGGAEGVIKQVQQFRESAGEPEILPVLEIRQAVDIRENPIARDFLESPWVEEVKRIEYPPFGVRVHLQYKLPVAEIAHPRAEPVLLDRTGAILRVEDVDRSRLGPLIRILGGLSPSPGNRPGKPWKSAAVGVAGTRQERAVAESARLAGFLRDPERAQEASASDALRIQSIIATDNRGLFIQNANDAMILWGNAPGGENSNEPEAKEKWEILRKWSKTPGLPSLPSGDYWAFHKSDLRPVPTQR